MKKRSWIQIVIRIAEPYQDLLAGLLALFGFTGFIQDPNALTCVIPKQKWNGRSINKFDSLLSKFKLEFPSLDVSYTPVVVHEENWNKKWEKQTGIV
ncbi:MAG: hypothetical protein EHM64_15640, partial [Ignavibacteriae bacterium]